MAADDDRQVGVERLLFLRSLPMSRPNGPEAIQIAAAMRDVHFRRGQRIFSIGEKSGDVFFLVKGSVRMVAPGMTPWEFEAPAVVGALDSFAGRPRTRDGIATAEVHALALKHTDWLAVLEEHFDFARESMLRLAAALTQMRVAVPGNAGFPPVADDGPPTTPLSTGLGLLDKTMALRAQPVFKGAGVQATLRLVELCTEIDLLPGGELFHEGALSEAVYAIVSGVVDIERATPPLRASFRPGSLVAGAAALGAVRHGFTARAPHGAVVLALRKDDIFDVMEDHFEVTRSIIGAINQEREEIMSLHGSAEDRALAGDTSAPRTAPAEARAR